GVGAPVERGARPKARELRVQDDRAERLVDALGRWVVACWQRGGCLGGVRLQARLLGAEGRPRVCWQTVRPDAALSALPRRCFAYRNRGTRPPCDGTATTALMVVRPRVHVR